MKSFRVLTDSELLERKVYCQTKDLCFITKKPLKKEFFVEFHSVLLGLVKINNHRPDSSTE